MKQCKRVQSGHLLPDIEAVSIQPNFSIPWRTNPNTANQISKLKASPLFLMDSLRLDAYGKWNVRLVQWAGFNVSCLLACPFQAGSWALWFGRKSGSTGLLEWRVMREAGFTEQRIPPALGSGRITGRCYLGPPWFTGPTLIGPFPF
ncbi:hypothetical protein G4B88_016127 [Cannabis sativa]|uniref:Uncharacterized protein n=1 Tax=Cannabis sativa TaxID=3483 RepID=A0A7J6FGY8_CANSA|nr:hypothetical protein G4B88_016127 [Cannabis sativa]